MTTGDETGEGAPRPAQAPPASRAPGAPEPPRSSRGLMAEVTAPAAIAAGLPWEGTLERESALRLCYLAAAAQASGLLELFAERGRYALHLRRGAVEHASSSAPEDDLGRFLVARGLVTAEAVADAERVKGALGGDLVAALAHLRLLDPATSFRTLQEHGAQVVGRALAVRDGAARWDPTAASPPSAFPLGSRWGLLCDAARRLDGLAVRGLLGERGRRLASRTRGRIDAAELKLTALEARAAGLFDGRRSPAQLGAALPGEAEVILRVALLLGETELLAFGELQAPEAAAGQPQAPSPSTSTSTSTSTSAPTPVRTSGAVAAPAPASGQPAHPTTPPGPREPAAGSAAPRPPLAPRPPAGAVPAASAAPATRPPGAPAARTPAARIPTPAVPGTRVAAAPPVARAPAVPRPDLAALRAFHERLGTADHFAALGVSREAPLSQVKAAYFAAARLYHPDAGATSEPAEARSLRAEIFSQLGEAWGVLGDEAKRAAYVQQLAGAKAEVDVSGIFRSEELFQRATVLVRTRQYERALAVLDEALQLNDEPEFRVWRAWAGYLSQGEPARVQSAAEIEAALKKVPRCMSGYLFLGQMAKVAGELDLAERHLRRGLALEPEHAELARELKFLRR